MQMLTVSMQAGPEGTTVVICSTGIVLIDLLFPLSASYLSHNLSDIIYTETMCYCSIVIYE
jgi:hypothetical protein